MSHLYYINLEKRTDRKIEIEKTFKEIQKIIDINFTRINAINGKDINKDYLLENNYISSEYIDENKPPDKKMNPSEIGCFLSHVKAWETFINSEYIIGYFFEDDVIINNSYFDEYFLKIYEEISGLCFDIIFLSRNSLGNIDFYFGDDITEFFYKPNMIMYGAQSYVLTKHGAMKLIKYINTIDNKYKNKKIIHKLDIFDYMFHLYNLIFNEKLVYLQLKPLFMYKKEIVNLNDYQKMNNKIIHIKFQ